MLSLVIPEATQPIRLHLSELHSYVKEHGQVVSPRGLSTSECLHFIADISDITYPTRTGINKMLWYVEGLNLVAGYTSIDALQVVAPKTTDRFYMTNAMSWYAEPLAGQLPSIIRMLQKDPVSRKAIAYIGHNRWRPEDTTCVTSVQFLYRNNMLYTVVNMRSLDLFLGFPYDVAMFSMLAQAVRTTLKIPVGRIRIQAASAHIYTHSYVGRLWQWANTYEWPAELSKTWTSAQAFAGYALQEVIYSNKKDV